jgi:hypothetical protein
MDLNQIMEYLNKDKLSIEEEQWLVAQLRTQEAGVSRLGTTLFPERLCQACESLLPDFVHLEVSGGDAPARYPLVAEHLEQCANCTAVYTDLTEMVTLAYADDVPVQAHSPQLDLSFLTKSDLGHKTAPSIWQHLSQAGQQVYQLFTQIRVQIAQEAASFGQLPQPLQPAWIATPTRRDNEPKQGQVLPLPSDGHDLSFHLIVGPVAGKQATLSIEVKRVSANQPLSRLRITMKDDERHLLASELTDDVGRVTFPRLAAGHYFLEIKYQDRIWELPMNFTWQPE